MLKKAVLSLSLVLGLFLMATQVQAQCGPNEVAIVNEGPCDKEVTIDFGIPCKIFGSVSMPLAGGPGTFACIPIPPGMLALNITVLDLATGNSSSVQHPACGPNQHSMHMACGGMCNIVEWGDDWNTYILPD